MLTPQLMAKAGKSRAPKSLGNRRKRKNIMGLRMMTGHGIMARQNKSLKGGGNSLKTLARR
jgi:hypothetical protein